MTLSNTAIAIAVSALFAVPARGRDGHVSANEQRNIQAAENHQRRKIHSGHRKNELPIHAQRQADALLMMRDVRGFARITRIPWIARIGPLTGHATVSPARPS